MTGETFLLATVIVATIGLTVPGSIYFYRALRRIPPTVYAEMEATMADMNRQIREQTRELAEVRVQQTAQHADMMRIQARVAELEIGIKVLSAQVIRLGGQPEWKLTVEPTATAAAAAAAAVVEVDDRVLTQVIMINFNLDEIDDLVFQLGIRGEEVAGETIGKRARSLVTYARRHAMTDELAALVRSLRPEVKF